MVNEVRYGDNDDDSDDNGCRTHRYTSFAEMINKPLRRPLGGPYYIICYERVSFKVTHRDRP